MRLSHIILLLLAFTLAFCKSYPEYTHKTKDLNYSYSKNLKRYSSIEKALKNPEAVEFLDVTCYSSDTVFQLLDRHIARFTNLKKLTLLGDPDKPNYFPKNLFKCKKLEFLTIARFRHLSVSDLDHLVDLNKLVFLALPVCSLSEIPNSVYKLPKLEGLDLTANNISQIPFDVKQLSNLRTIDLSNNCLTAFPNNLQGCEQLEVIDLINPEGNKPEVMTQAGICVNTISEVDGLDRFKSLNHVVVAQLLEKTYISQLRAKYPNIKIN